MSQLTGHTTTRPRLLFVFGVGHCGSTLLSLLLNAHPSCVAVSEVSLIGTAIRDRDPGLETDAWQRTRALFEQRTGGTFSDLDFTHPSWRTIAAWSQDDILAWVRPRAALISILSEVTGAPWIIDASKSWQQLYLLERSDLFDIRVLHLVRDLRGVVHSYKRKYGTLRYGLKKWAKTTVAAMPLSLRSKHPWLRVRYEDLARDPVASLQAICRFMQLDYDPTMLAYRRASWLGLGGNRMSKRQDETIHLDEKWRREMSRRDQLIVDLVGGAVNRYYGY